MSAKHTVQLTLERIAQLKAEATALKKEKGIKQSAALAQIAQREGFSSWEVLISKVGKGAEVRHAIQNASPTTPAQIRRQERKVRFDKAGAA